MNPTYLLAGVDLVAVLVLALAVYYPRHRRADLVTAFVAVNVGVLAVTIVLAGSAATVGLGLGLFGVLSIIRLRSDELGQHEIAYYFASLAIGLIGSLGAADLALSIVLMAGLVLVLALADKGYRKAVQDDPYLAAGVNVVRGKVTYQAVARSLDLAYTPLKQVLA